MRLIVPDDILTTYLAAAAGRVPATETLTPSVGRPEPGTDGDAAVLAGTGDLGAWMGTHRVVGSAGVATSGLAAVALGTAVRADMVDEPIVWLRELSATARLLARATIERYYGTTVRGWSATGEDAPAVVVEGIEAIRPPESGYRDDLGRAWFILNGVAVVTHLLLVPLAAGAAEVDEATRWVQETGGLDKERRKRARERLATRAGLTGGDLIEMLAAVRTTLEPPDLDAAKLLFQLARDPDLPTPTFARYGVAPPAEGDVAGPGSPGSGLRAEPPG